MPTFEYAPITRTAFYVTDAATGETYGRIDRTAEGWVGLVHMREVGIYPTRESVAIAVYHARHALGFEAGAL